MSRTDADHVRDAEGHLRKLREHLARGELADDTIFDAVCMRLSTAIESIAAIGEPARTRAFGESWRAIWSVRNRIAHGYVYLDKKIIEATVSDDLPEFEAALIRLRDGLSR